MNQYFAPATLEMTTDEDSAGQLANIIVKNDRHGRIRATLWREGIGEEMSTAFPILLVPGEVLSLSTYNRLMDLSFANEPIFPRIEQSHQGVSLHQIQD